MAALGSSTPGLSSLISSSLQFVISPKNMPHMASSDIFSPLPTLSTLYAMDIAPTISGIVMVPGAASYSASVSGASVAPNWPNLFM